jgi:nitrite reductase/ring-hydroxylating ferredoxin subunit
MASAAFSAYLGGDLSFRRAAGVDRTSTQELPSDWTVVADDSSLEEGKPVLVEADGVPIMLVRSEGQVRALVAQCSHQGGPLHEGQVEDGCITCPWHGSRFRLSDGEATSGPTAFRQPALEVRVQGGKVEVRR